MKKLCVSFFAGLVLLMLISVPAQATIQIAYSLNHGALTFLTSCGGAVTTNCTLPGLVAGELEALQFIGDAGGYVFSGTVSNDVPGEAVDAESLGDVSTIKNKSATAGTSLQLFFSSGLFTMPTGYVQFDSDMSIIPVGGGTATDQISFTNCIDPGSVVTCSSAAAFHAETGTLAANVGSAPDIEKLISIPWTGGYSISSYLDVQLGRSAHVTAQDNVYVLSSVPEPVSIALLGGVLLLTSGLVRRRPKGGSAV